MTRVGSQRHRKKGAYGGAFMRLGSWSH